MELFGWFTRGEQFDRTINRAPSPLWALLIPWLSVVIGSLVPLLPVITPAPILPPVGFLLLIAWRLMRPGLFPPWAGLPLGLVDDLYSGQPLGSAILLFSLALIAVEFIEARFPWRGFWQDWLTAALLVTAYLALAALLSGARLSLEQLQLVVPQLLLSIAGFPIIVRMVAFLDRMRLRRIRRLD